MLHSTQRSQYPDPEHFTFLSGKNIFLHFKFKFLHTLVLTFQIVMSHKYPKQADMTFNKHVALQQLNCEG